MIIVFFISIFFPGIISTKIHLLFSKERKILSILFYYGIYSALILLLMLIVLYFTSNDTYQIFNNNLFTIYFSLKYLLASYFLSVLLPLIYYGTVKLIKVVSWQK